MDYRITASSCFATLGFLFTTIPLPGNDAEKRQITALRISEPIKIDAVLDEPFWQTAEIGRDFTQFLPNPGAASSEATEVQICYDDEAIYVGAVMYDKPELISRQLIERDNISDQAQTDWFGIAVDPFQDGFNGFGFLVTPSGVQIDIKFANDDDDTGWDAVWDSEARITGHGWVVEMKIPYAAIRFPDTDEQTWNIHIARKIFRNQEEDFWSPRDPEIEGFFTQAGVLNGIRDVQAPPRLAFTPFLALYGENFYDKAGDPRSVWGRSMNGGMDVKYGLSDAFTLDMTLIPDFGQVQSDNEVLNLSPFEIQFNENRQFFTEGTELFNRAGIFYSRRIGDDPFISHLDLNEGDHIVENPQIPQLYNATKISGRTRRGTGLGFFNAIEGREHAVIRSSDGIDRRVETNPLTNYNVFVVDQNLKNNSYLSFINTNVWREGRHYDANVTGTEFYFRNTKNTYAVDGGGALSQKYFPGRTDLGYEYNLEVQKISGSMTWELGYRVQSDKYDPNDLGFLSNNNQRRTWLELAYRKYEAFGPWLRMGGGMFTELSFLYRFPGNEMQRVRDDLFRFWGVNMWWWGLTKNQLSIDAWTYLQPFEGVDYFEPRVPGRFYVYPHLYNIGININTDSRKRIAGYFSTRFLSSPKDHRRIHGFSLSPRLRVSDKLNIGYGLNWSKHLNGAGFVTESESEGIVFGRRDITDVENLLDLQWVFSSKHNLSFRMRHNWTRVEYRSFHQLTANGDLASSVYTGNEDLNFNAFTIDAVYRWRFAPGSDIFIVWKNNIIGLDNTSILDFTQNIDQLFELPQRNSLSLKVLYYFDYVKLRNVRRE
ncbi:MAG TPA: DUF5916 domain-containing protein [Saprospiraceae bacterium]|nr:DUF5916 domain-containing protein [Saprospiraceae bacterium]